MVESKRDNGKKAARIQAAMIGGVRELGVGIAAVAASFLVVAVLMVIIGVNPVEAYAALVRGSFGSLNGLGETLVKATPLLLIGLGIAIAFRGGMWNIGAEGQLLLGAIGATIAALYLPDMPAILHLPLVMLAGMIFGAAWGAIPGYLRARWRVNEIVVTIMMNYLALYILSYLVNGPMKDMNRVPPQPQSATLPPSALLPKLFPPTRAHLGILIAIVAAVVVWFVLQRTPLGYEIKAAGSNPEAAEYGGIGTVVTGTLAMILSGALAGLAGMAEISGIHRRLLEGISPGYGYLAIAVALFGGLNPGGILLSSLFFGALLVGADAMQRAVGVPVATVYLLQGLVLIFVLARRLLRRR
jgi:simple sugar transport system permease protein